MKTKILLLGHPSYTLPSSIDVNSSGVVIDNTLKIIPAGFRVWTLSPYKDALSSLRIDPSKYHYYNAAGFIPRLVLKLLTSFSIIGDFKDLTNLYKRYLVAIILECIKTRPDIIIVHTTKLPWAAMIGRIFRRSKVVIYQHNSELDREFRSELYKLKSLAGHIFVSAFARQNLLDATANDPLLYEHCSRSAMVVKNGVNATLFKPSAPDERKALLAKLGIPDGSFVIIFCGRLAERKGPHLLIDAYLQLPENIAAKTYLLIVGSDDYNVNSSTAYIDMLHQKARAKPKYKDHILFTGVLKNELLSSYYGISDVLVFPSIDLEGLPLVPLEAQACGLPVIASRIGGTAECLEEGKTGYFIDTITSEKLREQLLHYLQKPASERSELSINARRFILGQYTETIMAENFYTAMHKLLAR